MAANVWEERQTDTIYAFANTSGLSILFYLLNLKRVKRITHTDLRYGRYVWSVFGE
jgi:hypothetical protein